ncbi:MAG: hypothetical protein AB1500_00020 [Bacillota bacterium]
MAVMKLCKFFYLTILVFTIPGCFSFGFQSGISRAERISAEEARKVFQRQLKTAVSKADEIRIFSINPSPKETVLSLKRDYKRGEPSFDILTGVFAEAGKEGVVVMSPSDRIIVLLSEDREIYRFEYCNIDGRITSKNTVKGKAGILFIPENLISYIM